jgi:hypothetical protein
MCVYIYVYQFFFIFLALVLDLCCIVVSFTEHSLNVLISCCSSYLVLLRQKGHKVLATHSCVRQTVTYVRVPVACPACVESPYASRLED